MMKRLAIALTMLLHVAANAADAGEPLLGCWRSQQTQSTLADRSVRDQNTDCVSEYDAQFAHSRCFGSTGQTHMVSAYERIDHNTLKLIPLDPVSLEAKGEPIYVQYRIDDQWLLIEREYPPGQSLTANPKQARSFKSSSIRIRPSRSGQAVNCAPRGESKLRVGYTPVSSLSLTVPTGWTPMLTDPTTNASFGAAVNSNFLIGAFVRLDDSLAKAEPSPFVLVVDDFRAGPSPVRAKEFAILKQRFIAETAAAQHPCNELDRVCALLRLSSGVQVYTELLNVKGRVAMVSSSSPRATSNTAPALQAAVQTFVERLRIDNAN